MDHVFRSAKEAVGFLTEQVIPGDFVRVAAQDTTAQLFGRVLAPEDPALAEMRPVPGRAYVQTQTGDLQEFDPGDLEKVNAMEVPSEVLAAISTPQDQTLAQEVLAGLDPQLAEEFGLGHMLGGKRGSRAGASSCAPSDPERSAAASASQNNPDTRRKKSRAMKKNWRRTKSRSGQPRLGNDPSAMRQNPLQAFESLIEQELDQLNGQTGSPGNAGGEDELFSEEPAKFTDTSAVDPRVAYNMTMRVFEATDDIMKTLAVSRGMPYYMWIQDDPEEGTIRLKINGTCPKEIVERFVRDLEDIELVMLEKPEGDEDERNKIGNWVFETKLPGFPEEYEEPGYEPEAAQAGKQGEFPGEVVLPEEPAGPAMGV